MFADRLEVWSPGGSTLSQSTPLQDLLAAGGVSFPRNPLLAITARLMGLGEQLGRGLPVLRAAVAENTGEPVEIRSSHADVTVVIPLACPRNRLS